MASAYSSIRLIRGSKDPAQRRAGLCRFRSARPARLLKDLLRFAEVSCSGGDYRPVADQHLFPRPKGRANVILTNELGRIIGSRLWSTILSCLDWLTLRGFVATRCQK